MVFAILSQYFIFLKYCFPNILLALFRKYFSNDISLAIDYGLLFFIWYYFLENASPLLDLNHIGILFNYLRNESISLIHLHPIFNLTLDQLPLFLILFHLYLIVISCFLNKADMAHDIINVLGADPIYH